MLRLKHSLPLVQYMERIVRVGGCLVRALAPQAWGPGFHSWQLPASLSFPSPQTRGKQPVYFAAEARSSKASIYMYT